LIIEYQFDGSYPAELSLLTNGTCQPSDAIRINNLLPINCV